MKQNICSLHGPWPFSLLSALDVDWVQDVGWPYVTLNNEREVRKKWQANPKFSGLILVKLLNQHQQPCVSCGLTRCRLCGWSLESHVLLPEMSIHPWHRPRTSACAFLHLPFSACECVSVCVLMKYCPSSWQSFFFLTEIIGSLWDNFSVKVFPKGQKDP
jgi:hypothetical protein